MIKPSVFVFILAAALCATHGARGADLSAKAWGPDCLYDIAAVKAAGLQDLQWKESGREKMPGGALVIRGVYSSGAFRSIPKTDFLAGRKKVVEVTLHHPVLLIVPPGYPGGGGAAGWVAVAAQSTADNLQPVLLPAAIGMVEKYH
ncbi:MAG: hypothetical protein M1457_11985, partial [bacterium]|nr:hypothetical protein [bacterium]